MTGTRNRVGSIQMDVLQLALPRDGGLGQLAERDDLSPSPPRRAAGIATASYSTLSNAQTETIGIFREVCPAYSPLNTRQVA